MVSTIAKAVKVHETPYMSYSQYQICGAYCLVNGG